MNIEEVVTATMPLIGAPRKGTVMAEARAVRARRIYIGIDPGVNTGYALWKDDLLYTETLTFWSMVGTLRQMPLAYPDHEIIVIIENPALNKTTFFRQGTSRAIMNKISRNVGANCQDALRLIEYAEGLDLEVRQVRPKTEKWNRQTFERVTGHRGRTSQHARDAAKLVYGL